MESKKQFQEWIFWGILFLAKIIQNMSAPDNIKQEVRDKLRELAEPELRSFNSALIPGCSNILGVRRPHLRKLARRLLSQEWRRWLDDPDDEFHEETLLRALLVANAPLEPEERLRYLRALVEKLRNWADCDLACEELRKIVRSEPERFWDFTESYLEEQREFHIRFGVVMMLAHFVTEPCLERILSLLDGIRHEGYYVKMAVAWALSVCFIKFPERTLRYLQNNHLDDETFNKALRKIIDSFRVDRKTKDVIRSLRRKAPPQKS
jgi:3-methyladenine DNA glycosylase AlkD